MNTLLFEYYWVFGLLMPLILRFFDRSVVRINWSALSKFLVFMVMVTFVRFGIMDAQVKLGGTVLPPIPRQIDLWSLLLVYWEDCIYAIPLYYLAKWLKGRWKILWWAAALFSSYHFAIGHVYLGSPLWTAITFFYPVFISYRYGIRYGFGTVMLAHIMYDMFTVITVKLAPWIVY
jgi:hypothetical protein